MTDLAPISATRHGADIPRGQLKLKSVRRVFRLINDIREMGNDPQLWRPHMVQGLRSILHAGIVVSSEVHFRQHNRTGAMRVIDIGWVSDPDGQVSQVHTEREDERPEAFWLTADPDGAQAPAPQSPPSESRAAAKDEEAPKPEKKKVKKTESLDDDPDWYERLSREEEEEKQKAVPVPHAEDDSEDHLVPVRPMRTIYGGRSFIMSQVALPHAGAVDQLGVHREFGDEPFTRADHRLLRMMHTELARLWDRDVLRDAKDATSDLPPRLQQTLEELLAGSSEKQIAQKLELSRHTIHNYVKALHQRFEVSSRGELLAKAGKAKTSGGPKLSLTLPKKPLRKPDEVS
ncbi:helix-turn-helix transcriptional regulator [Humisphaera borealis]|uniref:HTH domain-containing protein n=1 Tax=Humisphaera borealis TaxID=2807512 RepID=A0A7M2X3F5_9BACT|nr:LuxR C-terminal-related transcriptional regulator [Humisphaera borealis]QOV91962.1 HTH domain-containing protein [Humisphaera borealis]